MLPKVMTYRVICERLEAVDRVTDAIECFHEMMRELEGEVYMSGPMTEWVSGELLPVCLPSIRPFWSDFTHQCLSAPGSDGNAPTPHASLNSPTPTSLLREWAKAKLIRYSWSDALLSADSVSISFCSPTRRGIDTCSSHFPRSQSTGFYVNVSKR